MDEQKVIQVLKEIFNKYGLESLHDSRMKKMIIESYIPDMLNKMEYRDENLVLTQALKSDIIFCVAASNVTEDTAKKAVDRLEKEEHMRSEDARFIVQCITAAYGRKISFETEEQKENEVNTLKEGGAAKKTAKLFQKEAKKKKGKLVFKIALMAVAAVLLVFVYILVTDRKGYRYKIHSDYVEITRAYDIFGFVRESVTEVEIPSEIMGKPVTKISDRVFSDYRNLRSVDLPESITEIGGGAFYECRSLTNIQLPENVVKIGNGAFNGCRSLTDIEIPKGLTSIEPGVFYDCSSLTEIELPEGITSISFLAFTGCSSLTDINIPDSVAEIGKGAFSGCKNLKSVLIPKHTDVADNAFSNCPEILIIINDG